MRRSAASVVMLWLSASAALADAPVTSPQPRVRPILTTASAPLTLMRPRLRPSVSGSAIPDFGGGLATSLLPRRRPSAAQRPEVFQASAFPHPLPPTAMTAPPARPENLQRLSQARPIAENMPAESRPADDDTRGSVCGIAAIKGTALPPIRSQVQGCGLEDGVKVTSVAGLPLSVAASIDCPTAQALNLWASKALIPTVGRLGGGVARIDVMGSYECRPRNNQRGAKVSEHGSGKAIDIGGFTLENGTAITVLKGWNSPQHGRMMRKLHRNACGLFGTVLGPAANGYHRNHFHFDTASYRSGSYCE